MKNKHLENFFFAMFSSNDGTKYELYTFNWVDDDTNSVGSQYCRSVIDVESGETYDCYGGDERKTTIKLLDKEGKEHDVEIYMDEG